MKSKKFKRNAAITLMSLFAASCLFAFMLTAMPTAKAEYNSEAGYILGASVRMSDDNTSGIRFPVDMLKADYLAADKAETGTLIIPTDLLNGALTVETQNAKKTVTTENWFAVKDEETNVEYMRSLVYLYGIPKQSFSRPITARGYVLDSLGNYHYTDEISRSFGSVAQAALEAEADTLSQAEKDVLTSYTQTAEEGLILDFTAETATAGWGLSTEYVESFKGATNLLKLSVNSGNAIGNTTKWTPAFWRNYYNAYDKVVIDMYVENAANISFIAYVSQETENHNIVLSASLTEGWNTVVADMSLFTTYFTGYAQNPMFWFTGEGWTIWFDSIRAANVVEITPTKSSVLENSVVTLSDNSATVLEEYTDISVKIRTENGIQTVTDGTFTSAVAGKANQVVYTAKNADGETVIGTYKLSSYSIELADKLYDLSNSSIVDKNGSLTYYETYDGESGVLSIPSQPDKFNNFLRGKDRVFDKSYYSGADTLIFRVKTDATIIQAFGTENPFSFPMSITGTKEWVEYELAFDNYYGNWDAMMNSFWAWQNPSSTGKLYISEIRAIKKVAVTNNGSATIIPGLEYTLNDNSATVFAGCTDIRVEILSSAGGSTVVTNGKFTPNEGEKYTVYYSATNADGVRVGGSYIVNALANAVADKLYDFSTSSVIGGHCDGVSYLEEYDGETGVMKIAGIDNADKAYYGWLLRGTQPMFDQEYYAEADTLIFRAKTDLTAKVKFGTETGGVPTNAYPWEFTATNQWQDYEFDFSYYKNNWNLMPTQFNMLFFGYTSAEGLGNMYISEIRAIKKAAVTNNAASVVDINTEYTLNDNSATVFEDCVNVRCEVLLPYGGSVVITDGKFTPTVSGSYVVNYTATNATGARVGDSYVVKAYAQGTLYDFSTSAVLAYSTDNATWLSSFDGEQGVVKVKSNGEGGLFLWRGTPTVFDKAYYEGKTKLIFRIKTDNQFSGTYGHENVWFFPSEYKINPTTEWTDVTFDFSIFYDNWDSYLSKTMIWATKAGNLYISEIRVE